MVGTAISGLISYVLTQCEYRKLNTFFRRALRGMMQGKACTDGPVHKKAMNNKEIWDWWHLLPVELELQVARIRWMQQWARFPERHGQVAGAVNGRMRLELSLGHEATLGTDGNPTEASIDTLLQFSNDLLRLRECDEDFREAWRAKI